MSEEIVDESPLIQLANISIELNILISSPYINFKYSIFSC